jgi:GntR family transcriptional regulator
MKTEKIDKLLAVVDEAVDKARGLGFSPEEFSLTLYARVQTGSKPHQLPPVRALFIECNRPQLRLFSSELKKELALRIDSILVKDLRRLVERAPQSLRRYGLVITTFYHIREVKDLLAETGIEVVGLMVEAGLETLMRLTALPEGTKVGVACHDWTGAENLKRSIENAGLKHLHLVSGCGQDRESLNKVIEEASVIVCSILVEKKIRGMTPRDKEIIVDDRRLDKAGIEMLRSHLKDLSAGVNIRSKALQPASDLEKPPSDRRKAS